MISAIVLAKNEEGIIARCLKELLWCDEVLVIDDFSDDKTVEIAKNLGVEIFKRKLNGDFAKQRNFGLQKAQGEWVLFVDADEIISSQLAREIKSKLSKTTLSGFYFKRIDVLWGRELHHGEIGSLKLLRLARKEAGVWKRRVHEYWDVNGRLGIFSNPLLHYPHQTLAQFLKHIDFYSNLHAKQKYQEGERSSVIKIVAFPVLKFVNNWIFRGGFLDGLPGFVVAFMMSFHSFLSWGKLWLLRYKS